jgi:uncharacterized protein (TIGR03435 family)
MIVRFLLPLLAMVLTGDFGMYGPVTAHLKAGDFAPDVTFSKVLNAPGPAPWSTPNLSGKLTVLSFFPDTSHNLEAATQWNEVVEQFADKAVQFIWITGEEQSTLLPWLSRHPVKGWVLHDPQGQSGHAYGLELPVCVIIGPDRRIVGFDSTMLPTARTLDAALEGRITTAPQSRATIKAFTESNLVLLDAEPRKWPRIDEHKPDFPPSYTLHVAPSQSEGRDSFTGPAFRNLIGYGLKDAVQDLYHVNPIYVLLPASLDNGRRYDFALLLPEKESESQMNDRMRQGIEEHFHMTATRENRLLDVYVVTAPDRKPPAAKAPADHEMFSSKMSSLEYATTGGPEGEVVRSTPLDIAAIRSIRLDGTVDEFCHTLESKLDRPMVNDTNLQGEFEFDVENDQGTENTFLQRLHDRTGLVITPAKRNVEILVFRAR